MKIRSINQDVSAYQDQRITWLKCNIAKIRFSTNSSLAIKVSKQSGGMCQWAEKIHKRKERPVFQIRRTLRKTHKSRHFLYQWCQISVWHIHNWLGKFIKLRIEKTDFSDNPCAFTEAPAEGIFSIYDWIITGRESLNLADAVSLTRIALHGPPPATSDSAKLAVNAMQNYWAFGGLNDAAPNTA